MDASPPPTPFKTRRSGRRFRNQSRAERYLHAEGLVPLFLQGEQSAMPPNATDLDFLHRVVRRKRPACVLEFGSGNSTIAIAHALRKNHGEAGGRMGGQTAGVIYSVDSNAFWLDNTRRKLPDELHRFVHLLAGKPEVTIFDGELCHLFPELPNIQPDIIFLDGPASEDVVGAFHGLGFTLENGRRRPQLAADPLLYEGSLKPGALIIVDGRDANTRFLRRRLKRTWRFQADISPGLHQFELLD